MSPKPRPVSKDGPSSSTIKTPSQAMPPPPIPAPQPPPQPQGILVPETTALSTYLRSATVKVGQIYEFYADTKRLRINRHAPYPPRSLISALGRDVEKYDQLCDAMQCRLQRAITVLKRDLAREENRQKMAAAEAAAKAAASAAPPPSPSRSPTVPEPPPTSPVNPETQPQKAAVHPMRRQSTISLSSLHRPPFPHKLDLSTTSLRLNPDDPMLQSGLASPVTLAPKSSIPKIGTDFPFPVPGVDIDLTVGEDSTDVSMHGPHVNSMGGDPTIGSSADKPIELDLDIDMNLFNANPHPTDNIQSGPLSLGASSAVVQVKQEDHQIELDFLNSLQGGGDDPSVVKSDDILASLDATALAQQSSGSAEPGHDILTAMGPPAQPDMGHLSEGAVPPSPTALLAGLEAATDIQRQDTSNSHANSEHYDFSELGMDMQELFDMGSTNAETSESKSM